MENIVPQINDKKMMTTREIAELTGKRHDNVLADVRKLIEQGAIGHFVFTILATVIAIIVASELLVNQLRKALDV